MKTVTIELDGTLAEQVEALSRREGKDDAAVILDVLKAGLSETQARTRAAAVLEEILARPVPPPFAEMTEAEVIQVVEEEIAQARRGACSA